jgi:hypothetical protein
LGKEEPDMEEFDGEENVFIPLQKGCRRHCGQQGRIVREDVFEVLQSRTESGIAKKEKKNQLVLIRNSVHA